MKGEVSFLLKIFNELASLISVGICSIVWGHNWQWLHPQFSSLFCWKLPLNQDLCGSSDKTSQIGASLLFITFSQLCLFIWLKHLSILAFHSCYVFSCWVKAELSLLMNHSHFRLEIIKRLKWANNDLALPNYMQQAHKIVILKSQCFFKDWDFPVVLLTATRIQYAVF